MVCAILKGMEKIATDIFTFEDLRKDGFTYVDKTDRLLPLVDLSIGKLFFVARPRRFGKSLCVSTLEALFEGRRDLFKGLSIETRWDWSKKWPVLHLDLGSVQPDEVSGLDSAFVDLLDGEATRNNVPLRRGETVAITFSNLVKDLAAKSDDGRMVLLIDEYDKPLLKNLNTPAVRAFRDALKAFYSVVKTLEGKQRFTFITGISKFSKVSIFSDLNNLVDVTMDLRTATLFGYTHDEVKACFPNLLDRFARTNGWTTDDGFNEIVKWYDGYRFHPAAEPVVNPVSLGYCLSRAELGNYWSKTAMTTFLMDTLREKPLDFSTIDVDESVLDAYEPENADLTTLLYQTGYLTIRDFRRLGGENLYTLDFPNYEVRSTFLKQLVPVYTGMPGNRAMSAQIRAAQALYAHEPETFVKELKSFFADIPYDLTDRQNEQMWQTIVYVILRAFGANVEAEVKTNDGRIDMVARTPSDIYLVEFKLGRSAKAAIRQIREKEYAAKYATSGKRVTLIGLAFSKKRHTIVSSAIEPL